MIEAKHEREVADSPEAQALQKRIITLEDLHQHVLALAADLRIEWINDWRSAMADLEAGIVRVYPIKSEKHYAVALHEIGHIRAGPFDDRLLGERRAWEWARANALVWTPTMQRQADRNMRSYETDAAHLVAYYYSEILAIITDDLLCGNADGVEVYEALIRNAVEIAEMYENYDPKEARRVLIWLIDKYLAAAAD
jgi:hypothetical protein